ncbi:TRAP transporter large permease [Siminovitchia sediminis]|uniref:TRAP transporter large permease n=1 Tax=Siminovitchia sediminis TaxID=1274353 RepID=A0ABW4KNP5_9BACI
MSATIIALLGIGLLFLLMSLKMPISFSMFLAGFLGLLVMASPNAAFGILTADLWNQLSSYSLSVIPLFILMGEIVFRTGITEELFKSAYKWIGQYRGGMASTTIVASAGFAAISGSNSATAATMGTMALPELKKYQYDDKLSAGSVAGGGTLGIIIPPSTVLIVIAIQTEQSIKDLFLASLIPGAILVVLFLLTVIYLCRRDPSLGPPGGKTEMKEKFASLAGVVPVFLLFIFVIGGLFIGWFTPTESGAFGAFGALILAMAMRKLTWGKLVTATSSALKSSAMVMMLIVGAMVFGRFLTITRLPYDVADWAGSLNIAPILILIIILAIFVLGGAIMDAMGFLIIAIPIFFPLVIRLGYDPIWFAVILCIVTSLGAITPPVGVNAFVVKGIRDDISINNIFRGIAPFMVAYIICIALLIAFPQMILFAM